MIYDVMIDIETLSTETNAVIVSIAAIKFDRNFKEGFEYEDSDKFYIKVHQQSCLDLNMHVDPDTVAWWGKQEAAIRHEALDNQTDRVSIQEALSKLSDWIGRRSDSIKIWSHGDDFDTVILSSAYKTCNQLTPWKFWNTRDTRTVYDIFNINLMKDVAQNNKHHPLYDCSRQIQGLEKAINRKNK